MNINTYYKYTYQISSNILISNYINNLWIKMRKLSCKYNRRIWPYNVKLKCYHFLSCLFGDFLNRFALCMSCFILFQVWKTSVTCHVSPLSFPQEHLLSMKTLFPKHILSKRLSDLFFCFLHPRSKNYPVVLHGSGTWCD